MGTNDPFRTDTKAKIRGGKSSPVIFDADRYWEIVGELTWRGGDRFEVLEAAKWCCRAKPGSRYILKPDIEIVIERKSE